jgi:hypothetical protein
VGQQISEDVNPAALPGGVENLGSSGLQTFMRVRDHERNAAQPAPHERAQEGGPKGFGLGRPDCQAENFPATVGVDTNRDYHGHRDDPAGLADLHVGRVDPEVRPVALDRTVEKGPHSRVDLGTEPRDLALADARHPHRLDQLVDAAGRDALHVSFLDHRRERLLGGAPRFEEAREVRALAELGDLQLDRTGPRLPRPVSKAVALVGPRWRAFAVAGAAQALDLQRHQPLGDEADHLAQEIDV